VACAVKEKTLALALGPPRNRKFPNVLCKISGLIAYADPHHWTAEDLRPYVDHAIECFGWDRVMLE